jgi:drug/metabolite transporter (DMT)-like permease
VWLWIRGRGLLKIARRDLVYFSLLGTVLAATHFTYLYAISRVHVAAAILLQYQSPVLIVAYSVMFRRKRPLFLTIVSLFGALWGCYLMVGAYNLDILDINRAGIISGLASAVFFAWYSVKSEYGMRIYSPWTVLFYALFFAAVIWNVLEPPLSAFTGTYSIMLWCGIFFVGIFGTVLPFGLYNEGIRLINSTRAGITATLEPVVAGVIAWFFIGETLGILQIMGAGLIIASILLLQTRKKVYLNE